MFRSEILKVESLPHLCSIVDCGKNIVGAVLQYVKFSKSLLDGITHRLVDVVNSPIFPLVLRNSFVVRVSI